MPVARLASTMNYSICLLDAGGRTKRTEFGPFDNDGAALDHARGEAAGSSILEVWNDGRLVERLFQQPPETL